MESPIPSSMLMSALPLNLNFLFRHIYVWHGWSWSVAEEAPVNPTQPRIQTLICAFYFELYTFFLYELFYGRL